MTTLADDINPRLAEMIQGYWDGKGDYRTELPKNHNYDVAYVHGWMNGRDDRLGKPREKASVLRARANMSLGESYDTSR